MQDELANQESIQIPDNQSATDFLKEKVAKAEDSQVEKSDESISEEEETTTNTPEGESGEESITKSDDDESEEKTITESEGDILDESDVLKNLKFSETTFEELRKNYLNAQNRNKLLNFGVNNIPGFLDYIKDNFERSQKGMDIKPVSELSKGELKEPDTDISARLEAMVINDPETGEPMTLVEKQNYIKRLSNLLNIAGFARKEDIDKAFTEEKVTNAQKEATKNFQAVNQAFGESIKDDLKALDKKWIDQRDPETGVPISGVFVELMDIIENELGITDPSRVTKKLLEREWKSYLLDVSGGLDMIKTNAKKSAEADHRRKIKIRMPSKTTTEKPKSEGSIVDWANKNETTPTMIREALKNASSKARR